MNQSSKCHRILRATAWMLLSYLAIPPAAHAASAPFESVIEALAIPIRATHTNNAWENASRIKGVQWKWPYHDSGAHDSTMVGTTRYGSSKNPYVGGTVVTISGARTFISMATIAIENAGPQHPSPEALVELFGAGSARQIKSPCDDDSASNGDATFQFQKSGFRPVFIRYSASWGASGSGGVEVKVANRREDTLLDCQAASQAQATPPAPVKVPTPQSNNVAAQLVGVWRCQPNGWQTTVSFAADGVAVFESAHSLPNDETTILSRMQYAGRYSLSGDIIRFNYDYFSLMYMHPVMASEAASRGQTLPLGVWQRYTNQPGQVLWSRLQLLHVDHSELQYQLLDETKVGDAPGRTKTSVANRRFQCRKTQVDPAQVKSPIVSGKR